MYRSMNIGLNYHKTGIISACDCYELQGYYLDFQDQSEAEKYLMKDVKKILSLFEKYRVDFFVESWDIDYNPVRILHVEQTLSDQDNDVFSVYVYDSARNCTERKAGKKAVSAMILESFRQLVRVNESEKNQLSA